MDNQQELIDLKLKAQEERILAIVAKLDSKIDRIVDQLESNWKWIKIMIGMGTTVITIFVAVIGFLLNSIFDTPKEVRSEFKTEIEHIQSTQNAQQIEIAQNNIRLNRLEK
jgi:hypothetical protein